MIQKFKLSDNNYLDNLNDFCTKNIYLENNKLIFEFDNNYKDILDPNGNISYPYNNFSAIFMLGDNNFCSRNINLTFCKTNVFGRKKLQEKDFTIKEFIEFIEKNNYTVEFISQYFYKNCCLIEIEIYKFRNVHNLNGTRICGTIELGVEEIIYTGEEII